MENFIYNTPTKVFFGKQQEEKLGEKEVLRVINEIIEFYNIIKTIELNNSGSPLVTSWKEKNFISFRYQDFTKYIDYVVIFEFVENDNHKNPYLRLITAYPVFEKFTKDKFDKKYHEYRKKA